MGSGDLTSPEEIVREAERRIAARDAPPAAPQPTVLALKRGVRWLARHWVAMLNLVIALYLAGAVAAPVAMHLDRPGLARALYAFYGPFCHQYPHRSFFLFGEAAAYPLTSPQTAGEMAAHRHDLGDPHLGYKIALCQRDIAIYGMMLLAGLVYGPLRKVVRIPALPLWLYFLFGILPMALDGGVQWISNAIWTLAPGLIDAPFETIPLMRVLTGALFGLGVIAVGYPLLAEYFDDVGDKVTSDK